MNERVSMRPHHVALLVLICLIALGTFWVLSIMLRGFIIALAVAVGVVVVLAAIQYFLWGHEFAAQPDVRRAEAETAARREAARAVQEEELPLYLTDRERAELLRLLDGSLHDAHLGAAEGPSPVYRASARQEEDVLRSLREKLRTFSP
jgi:hypothetical protein